MLDATDDRRRQHHLAAMDRLIAALRRSPDAVVPAYPDWRIRELVTHVVKVHTMAAVALETAATSRPEVDHPADASQDLDTLVGHLLAAHDRVEVALRDTDLERVWVLREDQPPAAWGRRMLLETSLHAFDATAAESTPQPPPDEVGRDGVAEFLHLHGGLGLQAADGLAGTVELRTDGAAWRIDLATATVTDLPSAEDGPDGVAVGAVVTGPPTALWLWCNRRSPLPAAVEVEDHDGTGASFERFLDGLRGPTERAGPA